MNAHRLIAIVAAGLATTSCMFHHTPNPENDPSAIAGLKAQQRVVNGDTTWVTNGNGYELVGRTRGDLVLLYQHLDRAGAAMRKVFPSDTLASVVAVVRRIPAEGQPFRAPPVVSDAGGRPLVELVVADPNVKRDENDRSGMRLLAMSDPTIPVVRAWLSVHASTITHTPLRFTQTRGDVFDARVPAWASEMIALLPQDSLLDNYTAELGAHSDAIIPLNTYFTMSAPTGFDPVAERRPAEGEGQRGGGSMPGSGGAGAGGMGGRGGRGGGGRMGGGRGGSSGGGGGNRSEPRAPLQGAALFAAQSSALGKYLSREGYEFIGALADAQIQGKTLDDVLAKRGLPPMQRMDSDWRMWLSERAAAVSGH